MPRPGKRGSVEEDNVPGSVTLLKLVDRERHNLIATRGVALHWGLAAGILEDGQARLHQLSITQKQRLVSETQEDREATHIAMFRV